jgi:hypothetical protein
MEILFESNSEQEEEFEYNGEIIVNKGHVQITTGDPFNVEIETDEAHTL